MDSRVLQTSKLKLPVKLERIYELFCEMELVCMVTFNRSKQLSLDSIAKDVAKNAPKHLQRIDAKILSKILYIYPTSYSVELTACSNKPGEPSKHRYVLRPNFREDICEYYQKPIDSPSKSFLTFDNTMVTPAPPISPQKARQFGSSDYIIRSPRKSPVKPIARPARLDFGPKFEASRRKHRMKIFKYKLFEFLKTEHYKYLQQVGVEFESKDENIFHPDFLLKHLPDIPCAKLPEPKRSAIQRTLTDYLATVQESPVLRSIEKVTQQLRTPVKIKTEIVDSPQQSNTVTPAKTPLKSRMNLLERIRAKEREAKEKEAARDLVTEARVKHLEELKINRLNVLYSEYSNHSSLDHSKLYQRLKCARNLRQEDFDAMVEILAEVAPEHFKLDTVTSKNARYLKMINKDLEKITQLVDNEIERCKAKIREISAK